jgi:putative Ca2+/H+ antiporter (TMEM165/GDT1 family)
MSFLVILVSEIGDKTFLIAAVMAMQHSRLLIFSAAMGALVVMTVLSAVMGQILPQILSKQYTDITAAFLFFVFGLKLLFDTLKMTGNECMEELEEVTQELLLDSEKKQEEGNSSSTSPYWRIPGLSPVWIQTFVMTFLAEWGDRSQIATVALSGSQNAVWVVMGGLGGHAICSGVAVVGGRLVFCLLLMIVGLSYFSKNR